MSGLLLNKGSKPWHCPKCKRRIASIRVDDYFIDIDGEKILHVLRCPCCSQSLYEKAGEELNFDKVIADLESHNLSRTVPLMSR